MKNEEMNAQKTGAAAPKPPAPPELPKAPDPVKVKARPPAVTVSGPAKGRWRAGRHFTPEPVTILLEDLAPGQLEALKADRELVVSGPA